MLVTNRDKAEAARFFASERLKALLSPLEFFFRYNRFSTFREKQDA